MQGKINQASRPEISGFGAFFVCSISYPIHSKNKYDRSIGLSPSLNLLTFELLPFERNYYMRYQLVLLLALICQTSYSQWSINGTGLPADSHFV